MSMPIPRDKTIAPTKKDSEDREPADRREPLPPLAGREDLHHPIGVAMHSAAIIHHMNFFFDACEINARRERVMDEINKLKFAAFRRLFETIHSLLAPPARAVVHYFFHALSIAGGAMTGQHNLRYTVCMESITSALSGFFATWTVPGYLLTKVALQRGVALVYLVAFIVALNQFRPLLGEHGLLPVSNFIKHVGFRDAPSLFHWFPYDWAFTTIAIGGIVVSSLALLGITERYGTAVSMIAWLLLWVMYLSFMNVGQRFYSFGWESLLLEAGFLAAFLGPAGVEPPFLVILLFRWLLFRTMFGAGMIKMRGDECWRDLTCLFYHFETQPMPNMLSWFFHWLPRPLLKGGVLFNHFVELVVPFGYFLRQPIAAAAGLFTFVFHLILAISGNFSWLSFVTMILSFSLLNDRVLSFFTTPAIAALMPGASLTTAALVLFLVFIVLSIQPVLNLFSPRQIMNTSYNPLHLGGSYGAFGSITRPRYEVIVEGTSDTVMGENTLWKEYEFRGKPGDVRKMPPQIAPYHLRLGWLLWFAAFSRPQQHPWFVILLGKLLQNDRGILSLLPSNPFPDAPPRYVRAKLYEYHFTTPEERQKIGAWWSRKFIQEYFPPLSLEEAKRVLPEWVFK
jgi:hypothetical protein